MAYAIALLVRHTLHGTTALDITTKGRMQMNSCLKMTLVKLRS
jgi:hypothetical protein